jgi:hypothetical protein
MGSTPWKRAAQNRWENEFSGKRVIVSNPGLVYSGRDNPVQPRPETVEGTFVGHGSWGGRPCIYVHTRPEMADVREPGYFDHEWAVIVEHGMEVCGV